MAWKGTPPDVGQAWAVRSKQPDPLGMIDRRCNDDVTGPLTTDRSRSPEARPPRSSARPVKEQMTDMKRFTGPAIDRPGGWHMVSRAGVPIAIVALAMTGAIAWSRQRSRSTRLDTRDSHVVSPGAAPVVPIAREPVERAQCVVDSQLGERVQRVERSLVSERGELCLGAERREQSERAERRQQLQRPERWQLALVSRYRPGPSSPALTRS